MCFRTCFSGQYCSLVKYLDDGEANKIYRSEDAFQKTIRQKPNGHVSKYHT